MENLEIRKRTYNTVEWYDHEYILEVYVIHEISCFEVYIRFEDYGDLMYCFGIEESFDVAFGLIESNICSYINVYIDRYLKDYD